MAFRARVALLALSIAAICIFCGDAAAQLTVINVPSTDTLQERMFYIEADLITKPVSYDKGGFQSYGYRTVYGVDRKTEVGVSFFYTRNGATSPKELQLSVKRKVFENEKHGVAATVGAVAYIPLNKSAGSTTPIFTYGNVSKTFAKVNGLRVTGGAYYFFNGGRDFGDKRGAMAALEQPVWKRVSLVADWYSGKNRVGYGAVGINFALTKNSYLMPSWNISNDNGAANYFALFYGLTF